ncbi:IS630 family transposase [candidate division KSB1 bacterium]|nr:IS630 family transposase [candidate division KSB1 bacterium]NIR72455.1 IS630 family transposase [candidate division KSB1 bacterium]NIS25094.1 IS630 family transposase [candidate division KSB1 bacterium]NIU25793.1 IS630 family transposase [candidate division KSB1 bacterium]NIV96435.1 IS630 family transposase [candidate division KSB1 bacterium]
MENDARKLTTDQQALLRRIAVQRVWDGESPKQVTESYGLGDKTIFKWLKTANEKGLDALAPKPRPGRGRKLSEFEEQEVKRWVLNGDPRQYGFDFGLWTRQIISDLIYDRFNVEIGLTAVGDLLHRVGLSPQRPVRRAYERNDAAIEEWKTETYPEIKKQAKKQGAEIFWLDEASIRSDDPLMRTWGAKGQTPVVQTSGQRQGIHAISAISNNGGFWYHVFTGKFNADLFIECLKDLMANRKKPIFIIMDGHPVHKSKKVKTFVANSEGKISIFLLPPYAPELNPDELVWNHIRQLGTARTPLKKGESLYERTFIDLELIAQDKRLIKSFFHKPEVSFAAE